MKGNLRVKKLKFNLHLSANEMAGQKFIKLGAYAIVIAVVGYADIAFIQIMSKHFLGGIFGVLSMIGAVTTAASIIALLFGKANWFRPGPQLMCAYIFTGAEVAISLANVLLSFELTSNQPLDQVMSIWYNFTAATPFAALVGWILILHFDQSQQDRHEQMEFEEKANKLKREQEQIQLLAQLEHDQQVFDAQMELSETYLAHETAYMQQFVSSPQVQQRLQAGAMKMAMETFSKLTGLPFVAGLSMPSIEQQPPTLPPVQQPPTQSSTSVQLHVCDACGKSPATLDGSVWLCQDCLEKVTSSRTAHIASIRASVQDESEMRQLFEKAKANPQAYTRWYPPALSEAQIVAIGRGEYIPGMYIEPVPLLQSHLDASKASQMGTNGNGHKE